jgi:hypothetical protein
MANAIFFLFLDIVPIATNQLDELFYRLLFGAGEDFEVYVGETIHYFVPDERRSCVEWYMASAILYDLWAEEIAKAAEEPKEASV